MIGLLGDEDLRQGGTNGKNRTKGRKEGTTTDEGESANDSKEGSINGLKDNAVIVEKKQRPDVRKGERVIVGTSVNVNNMLIFYCEITKYLNRNQVSLL